MTVMAREMVKHKVRTCTDCWLHGQCEGPVPFSLEQDTADYMMVGEAPGAKEDRDGVPFVGKAGRLLRGMLSEVGVNTGFVAFANVVSCRPPENRTPTTEEVMACRRNIDLQIAATEPAIVVLLGGTALKAFRPDLQVSKMRGRPLRIGGRIFLPTWHPAFVARKWQFKNELKEDLKQARWRVVKELEGRWPDDCHLCGEDVVEYDPQGVGYCGRHQDRVGMWNVVRGQPVPLFK